MIELNLAHTVLLHIWYLIVTQYLDDASLYYLCLANKAIFRTCFRHTQRKLKLFEDRHPWICSACFRRFEKGFELLTHINSHYLYSPNFLDNRQLFPNNWTSFQTLSCSMPSLQSYFKHFHVVNQFFANFES